MSKPYDSYSTILPVKKYSGDEVKQIRKKLGLTQKLFAGYMGVSPKAIEAWAAGTNIPAGAASRLLNMMEMDPDLIQKYPFIQNPVKSQEKTEFIKKTWLSKAREEEDFVVCMKDRQSSPDKNMYT